MSEETSKLFIELDGKPYPIKDVISIDFRGRFSCWGKIQLKGMAEPVTLGDGSYYNDGKHVKHILAGSPDKRDYNFDRLRKAFEVETY